MKFLALLGLTALLVTACGSDQKTAETTSTPATAQTTQVKAYPLDWCIISGEKLGEMGEPVTKVYQGREVKFCCKNCVKDFEASPVAYFAKIDSAAAGLLKPPTEEGHGG